MSAWRKAGGFCIGLGIFFLILFVISDSVRSTQFSLLGLAFGCMVLGGFLLATHPAPPPTPATRFRVLKRRKDEPKPRREGRDQQRSAGGDRDGEKRR